MNNLKYISILLLAFGYLIPLFPNDFSDKELGIIYTEAIILLDEYENVINQTRNFDANHNEPATKEFSEKVINLFINRKTIIYNDLDPEHQLSEFYEIETYINNLLLWYPDGMEIHLNLENIKGGKVIQHNHEVYSIDLWVEKRINGNYLNQTMNSNTENLLVRVAFTNNKGNFDNFKLAGIRNANSYTVPNDSKSILEVTSIRLNEEMALQLQEATGMILNEYRNLLNLLGNPEEIPFDKVYYRDGFLNLFSNELASLYNDLDPEGSTRWLSAYDYVRRFQEKYPSGIKNLGLSIDSAGFGNIVPVKGNLFYCHVYVNKFFSARDQSGQIVSANLLLDFKIEFIFDGQVIYNVKIASIDKSGPDFFEQESITFKESELPNMPVSKIDRAGNYIGVCASAGLSSVLLTGLESHKYLNYTPDYLYAYQAGIMLDKYLSNFFGISMGIHYSTYSSVYNISENELITYTDPITDLNGDEFYATYKTEYDTTISLEYFSVPVALNFAIGKHDKFHVILQAGAEFAYLNSATFKGNGYIEKIAEYKNFAGTNEDYIINSQNLPWTKDRPQSETQGNIDRSVLKGSNISIYSSIQFTIPLGYYVNFYFGPQVIYGITDIQNEQDIFDEFLQKYEDNSVFTRKFSLMAGIRIKL